MSQNISGSLQFVKGDGVLSEFTLIPSETYTIGTQANCNIRLKVQTVVPECSILKINSQGFTEFLSNGVSRCVINNKPFRGTRYLIPGDIIDLFGRKFKYLNPALTNEKIDVLQRENRKLFCNDALKEKVKRPTMFLKRNVGRTSILTRGFRTPGARRISKHDEYGSRFMVEDIENQPITPSQNSEGHPRHQKRFKNLFSTPQPTKSSDDNHFSFVQNYQINVNFGGSPASPNTPTSKEKYLMDKMDSQPSDIVSVQNSPFDKHITKAADDVTLINDISDPFSETPESGKEFISTNSSSLQHRSSSPQRQSEETEAHNSQSVLKVNVNKIQDTRQGRTSKSVSKKRSQEVSCIVQTPKKSANKENRRTTIGGRTPKTIAKCHNDTDIVKETPYERVSTRSVSMTPDLRKLKTTSFPDDNLSKTPLSTAANGKMNFTPQFTGKTASIRKSILKKTPYIYLVKDSATLSPTTPPRRCSQRMIEARGLPQSNSVTKKRSEATENAVQSNNEPEDEMLSKVPSARNSISAGSVRKSSELDLKVMINDDFVTKRSSKKASAQPIETVRIEEADIAVNEEDSDVEYSRGSSSSHYDSDREEKRTTNLSGINSLELSVLDSPLKNKSTTQIEAPSYCASKLETYSSDQENVTADENESYVCSLETSHTSDNPESVISSQSIQDSNLNSRGVKRSRSSTDSSPNILRRKVKRRMSTNELTDMEGIKDLLDMAHATPRLSFNELTDYEGIKDLLDVSSQAENSSVSDSISIASVKSLTESPKVIQPQKSDLIVITGVKQLLSTPKIQASSESNLENVSIVKRLLRTPKVPQSSEKDLSNVENVKKLITAQKHQKKTKNDLDDVRGVKRLLKTPKTQKQSEDYLTNVGGVKKLTTPKVQTSPKNDLRDVRGVKQLLKTPKEQTQPKNDLTNIKGVKKLMATPKPQNSPKNDLSDIKGVKKLMATPKPQKLPKNDLSEVKGVKKLMSTPKFQKSPKNDLRDVKGMKKLMATPKPQKPPKNDLSDVRGVKKLMSTPKLQKSPKNDLSDVRGMKKLMATPKPQKSPKNDLSEVKGVKKLMSIPKLQKSPKDDLSDVKGMKKLMASPKSQNLPKNDLTDVRGVKKLFSTPKEQDPPKNDLTNVHGVKDLFKMLEDNSNREVTYDGLKELFQDNDSENDYTNPFDKLINRKSFRTYHGKNTSPGSKAQNTQAAEIHPSISKWVEEQRELVGSSKTFLDETTPTPLQTNEYNTVKQRPVRQTRRKRLPSVDSTSEQEVSHVNTRSGRGKRKTADASETEDVSVTGVNTRQKSKKSKIEKQSQNNNEEQASTPVATRRTRDVKQMENKEDESSETEVPLKRNKRPTRKASQKTKSTRSRKQPYVDKFTTNTSSAEDDNNHSKESSKNKDDESGATNGRTSDLSSYELVENKKQPPKKKTASKAARSKIEPVEEEKDVAPLVKNRSRKTKQTHTEQDQDLKSNVPSKRGRSRKTKTNEADHDDGASLTKEIVNSTTKRKLYDPETVPAQLLENDDHIDKAQSIQQKATKRSRRNIYLPAMLEEFEHNLSGSAKKTEKKSAPKRTTARRKATTEMDSHLESIPPRVTRSRTKT